MKRFLHLTGLPAAIVTMMSVMVMIVGCSETSAEDESDDTLKEAYRSAFLMGAAVNNSIVSISDEAAASIVQQQFNTITSENVMKPGPINPSPGEFNFEPADRFVEYGVENDMFIVGHTLVWHNQTPGWFFEDEDGNARGRDELIERMRSHIETVAGRYHGSVDAWDVVNEAIHEDGTFRPTPWFQGIGEDFVQLAFEFAAEYAPDTELYYNDFNAWRPEKRDGIMRLVRNLQENGARVDGIGIQAHWGLNYPRTEYIQAAIDSFSSLGVQVMITELDIDVLPVSREGQLIGDVMHNPQFQHEEFREYLNPYADGLPDDIQQELADRYAEIFNIFLDNSDKISRVTFWGVHDAMTWKNNSPVRGRTNYPLLYDRDRQPKPAFEAVLNVPLGY